MTRNSLLVPTGIVFCVLLAARLLVAALVPVVQDEAYYLEWSKVLDWGYFDHPPLVAWIGASSRLAPASAFAGRLGAVLAATLAFPFTVGLLLQAGLSERRAYTAGLLLVSFNLCGLVFGVLTTPDAVFVPAWCAALHEAGAALKGSRRRWLTAGLATGIGLLSKYIMVLIGPVFLWGLLAGDRRGLRTPWPYAGGLVALLVFAPHIAWNAQNEWVPMRLQIEHGFQGGHEPPFRSSTDLPAPRRPAPDGPEMRLGTWFGASLDGPPRREDPPLKDVLERTSGYLAAVVAVWGAFLALLVPWAWRSLRGRLPGEHAVDPRVRPLLIASAVVPVAFFGFTSLFSSVEANWPAVYTVGAAVLLAGYASGRLRTVAILAGLNLAILLAAALYAHSPVPARGKDRILKETYGWRELSAHVADLDGPVFADREQRTSMVRFYTQDSAVTQWPGATQPSEFVRRAEWQPYSRSDLVERGSFWYLKGGPLPPLLEGFVPVEMKELRACAREGVIVTEHSPQHSFENPCPDRTVHTWYLIRYRAAASREEASR